MDTGMNEPKKRGRPAKVAAILQPQQKEPMDDNKAQAYAIRVWNGQTPSLGRGERVRRVKAAVEAQGLSFDGVKLPGSDESVDRDPWSPEDFAAVTWRRQP